MRHVLAILLGAGMLVVAGVGTSAPHAVDARVCVQRSSAFNIHLLGDKDGFVWISQTARPFTSIRQGEAFVTVWSLGGPASTNGVAIYGWATRTRSRLSTLCSETSTPQTRGPSKLGAPVRVKDGWSLGRRFTCLQRGRFVVDVRDFSGGRRMTVRMERSGEILAVAEIGRGGGSLRASNRCERRSG